MTTNPITTNSIITTPIASLPESAEVLIAGAGVAGASLHHQLALRAVSSLLLERSAAASGASSVPAALLNPNRGRSAHASDADLKGLGALWRTVGMLEAEGGDTGAHRSGVLRVADNARQARAWQRLSDSMPETVWLEPSAVPDDYHAPFGALLVEAGGWLEPRRYLSALTNAAAERGAVVRYGAELTSLQPGRHGGLSATVRSAHGEQRVNCRLAVLSLGAWRPAALAQPRFELVAGDALELQLASTPPYPLAGSVVTAFQGGRALVSGGHRPVASVSSAAPTPGHPEALQRALAWQLPAAATAATLSSWHGVRVKRPSGEPVARRLYTNVYYFGALGGRGFLRAAGLAERLADQLLARLRA